MTPTEVFEKLKSLQVVLGRKYELEGLKEEAPKQLSSQDEFLAALKKEFINVNNEYESVKETVNKLKLDLDEVVKTREMGEKNMDNISTHREYEALDKQISEASIKEAEIRKELQKQEKVLAELNDKIESKNSLITSTEDSLNKSRSDLESQIASYDSELKELRTQESDIAPGIDQEILFKFQRIIQRNAEGIVAVTNGVCTGCHMILPAQFANEVREGKNILFCPYCSRILYYKEAEDENQENFIDEAGSLADDDDDDFLEEDEAEEREFEDEGDSSEVSTRDEDADDMDEDSEE